MTHEKYMQRAITLARRGIGKTAPNPAVGCVIVRDGVIVGEGWHKAAGTPHAEVHALRQAGELARNADVYVTLEPCAHYGKTPPCAEALIAAGAGRVFVGMIDPNPKVCSKGVDLLRGAGIEVVVGLLSELCHRLVESFVKQITTGLPFVILKCAMTLDGKIATASGDSKWISSERSRRLVHQVRSQVDAIMVGVETVVVDDPMLTARIPRGRDPVRIIIDSTLRIPLTSRILNLQSRAGTIIATCSPDQGRIEAVTSRGGEVLSCNSRMGRVDLQDMFERVGARGIQSVLLEGGSTLAGEALRGGFIDKVMLFYAPKLLGGEGTGLFAGTGGALMSQALPIRGMTVRRIGEDMLVEGYPELPCSQV